MEPPLFKTTSHEIYTAINIGRKTKQIVYGCWLAFTVKTIVLFLVPEV
jgi:hypothetical protein